MSINLGRVAVFPRGAWSNANTYVKLDLVTYEDASYVCISDHSNKVPTDTAYWQVSAMPDKVAEATRQATFESNETTRGNTFTASEGSRTSTFNASETSRSNTFNAAEVARSFFADYNDGTAYVVGNKVAYNGSAYQCILASTGNAPTNTTYWKLVASIGKSYNPRGAWVSGRSYVNNMTTIDVVSYNGASYYCKTSTSGTTNPATDTTNWGVLATFGNASALAIADTGKYFASGDVEGAIQEVGAKLSLTDTDSKKYAYKLSKSASGNMQIEYTEVV